MRQKFYNRYFLNRNFFYLKKIITNLISNPKNYNRPEKKHYNISKFSTLILLQVFKRFRKLNAKN